MSPALYRLSYLAFETHKISNQRSQVNSPNENFQHFLQSARQLDPCEVKLRRNLHLKFRTAVVKLRLAASAYHLRFLE